MKLKKRGKGLKFLMSFLLLAGMAFHSCMDEGIIDAPTWHQVVEFGDDALVRDAKAMVDETQGELAMPDMFKTMGKVQTRSSGSAPQTLASGCFTFDWDAAQSFHEENGTVLIVPIKMMQNMAIWRFTVINNKRKAEQTPMHSVLYIKKFKRTGNIMGRVMSYAPSRKYMKKQAKMKKQNERLEWYNPDHTDYSGLLLISSLDGTLIHGYNYEEGHRQFMFRPNVAHQHNHSHEAVPATRSVAEADNCLRTEKKLVSPKRTVFSMRMISSTSAISSYSFDNETYVQPGCVICGMDPYMCVCIIVEACQYCYNPIEDCVCPCSFCNSYPCVCNTTNCIFCKKYPCECEGNTDDNSGGGGGAPTESENEEEESIPELPCYNSETRIFNPLIFMRLAPPYSWNIAGATFGNTRRATNGNLKFHSGIDLYAEIGTPVYAMTDGEVVQVVTNQVNRINGDYPEGYQGDTNGAGNRIKIKSTINGEDVYFSYWHLQAGNPVGKDRNGNILKENSHVYAGDIIGYTGITGNANADVPHLHLGVQNSTGWINPTGYLNATVNITTTTIITPCD